MRIAICGGTFDPFHRGHLEPVLALCEPMGWDRVLYVPAWRQPFKQQRTAASPFHRFAMAVLATQDVEIARVSPVEVERGRISYSVETLEELHDVFPKASFEWIIGDDNLASLGEWKSIERIFELANFVVLARDRVSPEAARASIETAAPAAEVWEGGGERPRYGAVILAVNQTIPVSATDIRKLVARGEEIDGMVDPRVARYIRHNGLYREDPSERFD
ncbi:MAG TPA: nicotinate (nicotinamide) nucleotide adenylyltransferase [Thermoanaerobaculia bacterium]|nr:nicotinate (nicotinamide) nucleotide adenylyltransferase [Thermoanaerobaculia bacterium]